MRHPAALDPQHPRSGGWATGSTVDAFTPDIRAADDFGNLTDTHRLELLPSALSRDRYCSMALST
jgi:hypothetical protein